MEKNTRFPVQWKDRREKRNIYIWRKILGALCSGRIEGRRGIYIYGEKYQVPCVVEGQKVGEEYIYIWRRILGSLYSGRIEGRRGIYIHIWRRIVGSLYSRRVQDEDGLVKSGILYFLSVLLVTFSHKITLIYFKYEKRRVGREC